MKRSVPVIGMALVSILAFWGFSRLDEAMEQPVGFDPGTVPDPVEYVLGIPRDTVLFTVDGAPVEAEEYLYWTGYSAEMLQFYQFGGGAIDWSMEVGGTSLEESLKESGLNAAKLYQVVENQAEKEGCNITAQQQADHQKQIRQAEEELGGKVSFEKWLLQVGLTREGYEEIIKIPTLHENLQKKYAKDLEAEQGALEDSEVQAYIETKDLLRAKHILVYTRDPMTMQPIPEEEKAAKKERAEELLAEIRASQEPIKTFDALMKENSEDPGLATNPEGYTFTAGEMLAPFEAGTRALEYGEISDLVESDFGYHIILRLDPATEELKNAIREVQAKEYMDTRLQKALESAVVETTEAYRSLDLPLYLEGLNALRGEIAAQDAAAMMEQMPQPSPVPTQE